MVIKAVPLVHGLRATEKIWQVIVGDVESLSQECDRVVWMVVHKAGSPEPWLARGGDLRQHYISGHILHDDFPLLVAVPLGRGGKWRRRGEQEKDGRGIRHLPILKGVV